MPEFGGLRKHEQTQHACVGLGSAALVAAVVLSPVCIRIHNNDHVRTLNIM